MSPASVVLTAGTRADPTLSQSAAADFLQGAAARLGNLAFNSAPVTWLFGADTDFEWFDVPDSTAGREGAQLGNIGYIATGIAAALRTTGTYAARTAVPSVGGVVRRFEQEGARLYYRVFSGEAHVGKWLTAMRPKGRSWAEEALALPPGNRASYFQEVLVPHGTLLERSRALPVPHWGRLRGGGEQFRLLEAIPTWSFGPPMRLR